MSGYSIVVSLAEETMTPNRRIQVFVLDVADHIGELPYLSALARDDDVAGQEAEKPRTYGFTHLLRLIRGKISN
jgi:hypothetical protein